MSDAAAPGGLLERPPEEASRLLALRFLDAARDARARLADSSDSEALHDFRVALRRLRSALRSFVEPLGDTVPRKVARRLKKLAGSTNALRDCEVQLEWLEATVAVGLPPAERRAARWLRARLQEIEAGERAACLETIERRHGPLDRALRRRLVSLHIEIDLSSSGERRPLELRVWLAARVLDLAGELAEALSAVGSVFDGDEAHRARIAAKRLRYLLEPFVDEWSAAQNPVAELKALQDALGALHDAQVLIATLGDLVAGAAAARARQRIELAAELGSADPALRGAGRGSPSGTLLIVDRLLAEQRQQFEIVEKGWLAGRAGAFFAGLEALAVALNGATA